jgi:hypothetical protein
MHRRSALLGVLAMLFLGQPAWAADPVAVLCEIRIGQGEIWVKHAGACDWMPPRPLLALHAGDQIRAEGDGQAALIFTGGGTQSVVSANSPYTVQAPTAESGKDNVGALVGRVTQFLLGQGKSPTYRPLAVRNPRQPVILSPRETKLLPGPVTFEWSGSERLRYSIRVRGPQGQLWEQAQLPRQPLSYPEAAPALGSGVRYTWELQTNGHPVQRAQFEVVPVSEAARVQEILALLQPDTLPGYSANTLLLLRAGFFFREGLYQEARRELLAGIAADPNEPALHLLLARKRGSSQPPALDGHYSSELRPGSNCVLAQLRSSSTETCTPGMSGVVTVCPMMYVTTRAACSVNVQTSTSCCCQSTRV